jgi:diguanylate cyclase (GGDEF)-like protein
MPIAETSAPVPELGAESRVVLLVGASASDSREAARWLTAAGFHIALTEDASSALAMLRDARPELVVVEGAGVCAALRAYASSVSIPVAVLCATPRDVRAALEAGATDVIERPFDATAARRIEHLARLSRMELDLAHAGREVERLRQALDAERSERHWRQHFDALTGLPDGERLERALESALAAASESHAVALALFSVEQLVVLNNRIGRARANVILQQVAQRLVSALRSEEVSHGAPGPSMSMAARLGGGTFAAMLTGFGGAAEAKATVRLLLDRLASRYVVGDEEIAVSLSVGVAIGPVDGNLAERLLQRAELAACEAAQAGGAIRFYGQSSHRMTERSRAICRLLPGALARRELYLLYQPIVDESGRVTAAEALVRWDSPELGEVSPSEFVPLAEETGLMVTLGRWVLVTACRQGQEWRAQGVAPARIAVNVSVCQLVRGDFAREVRESLEETGLPPAMLDLELSERGVMRGDADILRQLHAIRDLGVRIAIDDFGAGNSAVAYLKQLPIDVVKIDQSFVRGVARSSEDAAITSATIAMARTLGMRVVAEGVEEVEQMEFLRRHGCTEFQGFLFSPAVPAETFATLTRRDSAAPWCPAE